MPQLGLDPSDCLIGIGSAILFQPLEKDIDCAQAYIVCDLKRCRYCRMHAA